MKLKKSRNAIITGSTQGIGLIIESNSRANINWVEMRPSRPE